MAKSKLDYKHLVIEALLIVFTVSLALALSEWRSQVRKDQLVDRVLTSLKSETEKNILNLKKAIEYHDGLLKNLRAGTHAMITAPVAELPFNPKIDRELTSFIRSEIFSSTSTYMEPIEILEDNNNRYLRIGNRLSTIVIKNDSLFVYGTGNIILRSAQISNNSWEIAQATNAIIELDYDLVSLLGRINAQFEDYSSTTDMAISILYGESGEIQSALEDMFSMEKELLTRYELVLEIIKDYVKI